MLLWEHRSFVPFAAVKQLKVNGVILDRLQSFFV